jgi:HlyD family secretion protein
MRRNIILGIIVSGLTLLSACGGSDEVGAIVTSGHVEATDVRLAAKVGGRIESIAVKEGDAVTAGQELARIETTDIELLVRQARAERDAAAAELRLREAGARREDIDEMRAQLRAAEVDLEGAERDYRRLDALVERGSGSDKSRDDARTRRDMLAAKAAAMRASLAKLQAGFREEEVDTSRARLASVDARLAQLEQQLADCRIVAPTGGVVTETLAEPGELVAPGTPLLVITDLQDSWLNVYVGGPDLPRVRIGEGATIVTDDGQSRKGRITYVASQAEFTPRNVQTKDERVKLVFRVKIGLDNSDGMYKPGMPAEARIAGGGE